MRMAIALACIAYSFKDAKSAKDCSWIIFIPLMLAFLEDLKSILN